MIRIHDQPQRVHDAVHIFGNTLRVGILRQLSLGRDNRADIAKALNVSEDALTRQLGALLDHGLVESTILRAQGRPVRYTLNTQAVAQLFKILGEYWDGQQIPTEESTPKPKVDGRSYRKRSQ